MRRGHGKRRVYACEPFAEKEPKKAALPMAANQ